MLISKVRVMHFCNQEIYILHNFTFTLNIFSFFHLSKTVDDDL